MTADDSPSAFPKNTTGVDVTISVVDSNNNLRDIGTATSDASGFYSFQWTPDITGKYTVIATFPGSEGYYRSSAEAAFAVDEAPEEPVPPETPIDNTPMLLTYAAIAIIAAVAIVGAIIVAVLLRKH